MMVFMLDEIFSIRTEKILNAMKIQTVKKNNLEIQFICGFKKKTHSCCFVPCFCKSKE